MINQTQLYVGNSAACLQEIVNTLHTLPSNSTQKITIDTLLQDAHPWIKLMQPPYLVADVDTILDQTKYKLEDNEFRAFIFLGTNLLNQASANRLLKLIEEPHANYFFLFCTQKPHLVLPTIKSRCSIISVHSEKSTAQLPNCLHPFLNLQLHHPVQFAKEFDSINIKEPQTQEAYEILCDYWKQKLHEQIKNNEDKNKTEKIVDVLMNAAKKLPMPGSSKLFWKHLYVAFHHITS